ncbi:hypothetical protein T439DRAFT_8961 [Meredithblackwellia eburnea MCA 4105]
MSEQPPAEAPPAAAPAAAPAAPADDGSGDALDKGIKSLAGKFGFGSAASNSNVEKASDGVRSLFKKATGKDIPIADKVRHYHYDVPPLIM